MKARKIVIAGSATLAACGVLGMAPPAVQASSASPPTWTQQHPAVHPPARAGAAMAYDAATGTAVLFGGNNPGGQLGDTWTWDGTTWTQQAPVPSPPPPVQRGDGLRPGHQNRGAVRRFPPRPLR